MYRALICITAAFVVLAAAAGCGNNPVFIESPFQELNIDWGVHKNDPIKMVVQFPLRSEVLAKPLTDEWPDSMYVKTKTMNGSNIESLPLVINTAERLAYGTSTRQYNDGNYIASAYAVYSNPSLLVPSTPDTFHVTAGAANVLFAWNPAQGQGISFISQPPPAQSYLRAELSPYNPGSGVLSEADTSKIFLSTLLVGQRSPHASRLYVRVIGNAPTTLFLGDSLFAWDSRGNVLGTGAIDTMVVNGAPTYAVAAIPVSIDFPDGSTFRGVNFGGHLDVSAFQFNLGKTLGLELNWIETDAGTLDLPAPLTGNLQTIWDGS